MEQLALKMYESTRSNSILLASVPSVERLLQPGELSDPVLLVLDWWAELWVQLVETQEMRIKIDTDNGHPSWETQLGRPSCHSQRRSWPFL